MTTRVFISETGAIPGQEWFLNRERPLDPGTVQADFVAMTWLLDQSLSRAMHPDDSNHSHDLRATMRTWVQKAVQTGQNV